MTPDKPPLVFSLVIQGPGAFALGSDLSADTAEPMTLAAVAGKYMRGLRRLVIATRDKELRAEAGALMRRFNALVESRDMPAIDISKATDQERLMLRRLLADRAGARPGRRRFLQRFQPHLATPEEDQAALHELLTYRAQKPGAVFPHIPVFRPQLCDGCQACVHVCPTGALISDKDESGNTSYHPAPQVCDGCGLCVAGCLPGAIELHEFAPASVPMEMTETLCVSCNALFHWPRVRAGGSHEICPLCAQNAQTQALRRVLT